ncbi:MAG: SMP-30/gluconolactonase/LRE family protein [Steroidobacteraceae bacterium]
MSALQTTLVDSVDVGNRLGNPQLFSQTPPGAFSDDRIGGGIYLPVTQPTCVAFGGANLDHLFITTARARADVPRWILQRAP